MSCSCGTYKIPHHCPSCNPPKRDCCFEIDEPKCYDPCPVSVDTDCVTFNSSNQGLSLKNLNIKSSTSLTRVLLAIDSAFGNTSLANLTTINWHSLNPEEVPLVKLVEAIQFISDKLQELVDKNENQYLEIEDIKDAIIIIREDIKNLNLLNISSSLININSTDDLKTVIEKIIFFLENLPSPLVQNFYVDPKISGQQGNKLILLPDGLYVPAESASIILDEICKNPNLTSKFTTMVRNVGLKHIFHISNTSSSSITVEYITSNGQPTTDVVGANSSKLLTDVRKIITNPSSSLIITYKGNE